MTLLQEKKGDEDTVSGMLLVDKPSGPTSHDIVDLLREITGIDRIGHGGTLDPLASGLLPLFIGEATRMSGFVQADDKSYDFDVTLGVSTETFDSDGAPLEIRPVPPNLGPERIGEVLSRFVGTQWQEPPMYSAIKKDGVPLYKLARRGTTVERPKREISIYSLELLSFDGTVLRMRTRCSKGTYVRVLAHEIGKDLGCGGHISRLRRTSVGEFSLKDAVSLAEIESVRSMKDLESALGGPEWVFKHLASVTVLSHAQYRLQKGGLIPGVWIFRKEGLFQAKDTIRILSHGGQILGLAQALLDSEMTGEFPGGVPVAKMCLMFRSKYPEKVEQTPELVD